MLPPGQVPARQGWQLPSHLALMTTCHALPEAKIQLLDGNACSVLYHYEGLKIIFPPCGTVGPRSCSDAVSLPLDEEAEQEESHTHRVWILAPGPREVGGQ